MRRSLLSLLLPVIVLTACSAEPTGTGTWRRPGGASGGSTADDPDSTDPSPAGQPRGSAQPSTPSTPASPSSPTPSQQPPEATSTHGTGGPTGQNELRSAAGLSFIVNAPAETTKPHGLLVLLHGSTASNYRQFVGMMANVAAQHDLIRASILAPNGQGWNEGNQVNAAELLNRTVQEELLAKYDVDTSKVFFSGQSSGGGFLSSHFIPLYGKNYKGGAFLQCGAAPPRVTFAPDEAMKRNLRLHFEITTGDTIWPDSYANAVSVYGQAGMSLTKDNTKPGGHCAFDQQAVIQDHIAFMLEPR